MTGNNKLQSAIVGYKISYIFESKLRCSLVVYGILLHASKGIRHPRLTQAPKAPSIMCPQDLYHGHPPTHKEGLVSEGIDTISVTFISHQE